MNDPNGIWLSAKEAREFLGVSRERLRLLATPRIRSMDVKGVGRHYLRADVEAIRNARGIGCPKTIVPDLQRVRSLLSDPWMDDTTIAKLCRCSLQTAWRIRVQLDIPSSRERVKAARRAAIAADD